MSKRIISNKKYMRLCEAYNESTLIAERDMLAAMIYWMYKEGKKPAFDTGALFTFTRNVAVEMDDKNCTVKLIPKE